MINKLSLEDVVALLSYRCRNFGTNKACAEAIGVSPQYLHDVLHLRRDPGPKILQWLGVMKVTFYVDAAEIAGIAEQEIDL